MSKKMIGDMMRQAQKLNDLAKEHVAITKPVSRRYHEFVGWGIDPADALHPACAESAITFFLTTDDRIIKKMREYTGIAVMNPVQFVIEVQ